MNFTVFCSHSRYQVSDIAAYLQLPADFVADFRIDKQVVSRQSSAQILPPEAAHIGSRLVKIDNPSVVNGDDRYRIGGGMKDFLKHLLHHIQIRGKVLPSPLQIGDLRAHYFSFIAH